MTNNSELGMTLQKLICDKYDLSPNEFARNQFESAYQPSFREPLEKLVDNIFNELRLAPIECLTFTASTNRKENRSPHNFLLSNNRTLSLRTNRKGDKVAPPVVGQAGITTFNDHFSEIVNQTISNKEEIKPIIYNNIHIMLPIFIDYFFVSDYVIWIQEQKDSTFKYMIFDQNNNVDISLERDNFTFTKDLSNWNESTTIKYKGKSLAEVQIHKNRTFKFRFMMSTLSDLLVEQNTTNETFGITAEKVICDIFDIPTPVEYYGRYSRLLASKITPTVIKAFEHLPKATNSTGSTSGERGKNSKCSYDFVLEGNKTLSLKTNTGKMICPPEVGQPGAETCFLYFHEYIDGNVMTNDIFKEMILNKIHQVFPIYVNHLLDSDYLLWIFQKKENYDFKIYEADFANSIVWDKSLFTFTKNSLEEWKESNTLKYMGISIGEFQVHNNRSCFKFRFNMDNFSNIVKQLKGDK